MTRLSLGSWIEHTQPANVLLTASLSGMGEALAEPITIRFSHVVGENAPKGIGAQLFKESVKQALAGRVKVEVYPSSQHFTDEQILIALMMGDIELAAPFLAKFRNVSQKLQVLGLPFLSIDVAAVHLFQASSEGRSLLSKM